MRSRARSTWSGDNPYDVGMTGLIGFSSGYYAMNDCDVLLMLGTDFPYRQFYRRAARALRRSTSGLSNSEARGDQPGLVGDIAATLTALLPAAEGQD